MIIIQKILNILIKLIIITWTIISLFLLSLISIALYFVFKFQSWFLKRKFDHLKQNFKANDNAYNSRKKDQRDQTEVKVTSTNNTKNFSNIKTINRKLKIKDGEIL